MRVLFIGRIDYPPKGGGDAIQMEQYREMLISYGHYVDIASQTKSLKNYDVIHIFNVDQIFQILLQLKRVKGNPLIILHAIHQKYEYCNSVVFPSKLDKIINYHFIFKRIKFLIKVIYYYKLDITSLILFIMPRKLIYTQLFRKVRYYHFLSDIEKSWFEADFNLKLEAKDVIISGNGIKKNTKYKLKALHERQIDILIVGRIEPQKNTLNTIKYLIEHFSDNKIGVCGETNKYYKLYSKKVLSHFNENNTVEYYGKVRSFKMSEYYNNSKILLLPSFSEVLPLVELEAHQFGCIIVSTKYSATDDKQFSSNTYYKFDPHSMDSLGSILRKLLKEIDNKYSFQFSNLQTWENVFKPIYSVYEKI